MTRRDAVFLVCVAAVLVPLIVHSVRTRPAPEDRRRKAYRRD